MTDCIVFLPNILSYINTNLDSGKKYSTALALVEVMDNIYSKLDEQRFVLGIYFDLQYAFDIVNHEILLHKLYNYGIRGVAYDWLKSYLLNRQQYTVVNGCV